MADSTTIQQCTGGGHGVGVPGNRRYLSVTTKEGRTYFAASLGLVGCFRTPSAFLLLKPDFDGCLPELGNVTLDILLSLLDAPFTTVVAILTVLAGRHPRPGFELRLMSVSPRNAKIS
jgi:hypothetical protein